LSTSFNIFSRNCLFCCYRQIHRICRKLFLNRQKNFSSFKIILIPSFSHLLYLLFKVSFSRFWFSISLCCLFFYLVFLLSFSPIISISSLCFALCSFLPYSSVCFHRFSLPLSSSKCIKIAFLILTSFY